MANFEIKFIDFFEEKDFIKTKRIVKQQDLIIISGSDCSLNEEFSIYLDKSTAIKFAKTLRTEINKMID